MIKPFKADVFELFEALKSFASDPRCAAGADKILLDVIEGKGDVVRVPIPRSAAATFASVAEITGVPVQELYTAMLTSSADAFFAALAGHLAGKKH